MLLLTGVQSLLSDVLLAHISYSKYGLSGSAQADAGVVREAERGLLNQEMMRQAAGQRLSLVMRRRIRRKVSGNDRGVENRGSVSAGWLEGRKKSALAMALDGNVLLTTCWGALSPSVVSLTRSFAARGGEHALPLD